MATNAPPKVEPPHPPLARDAQGNPVAIPDGTISLRICRQTTGRPKEIAGPDRRPLRFPLETTAEDLADLCGADVYRVYALDEVGKVLDYVATVDVSRDARDVRNASAEAAISSAPRAAAPVSDLRFALEAMTHMMRVNCEALRAVTESQADWVKSIASAKGFFRNGAPLPPPPPQPLLSIGDDRADDDDDEQDEDEDTQAPGKTIYDVLTPLAEQLAPSVGPLVSMITSGVGAKSSAKSDLASKPKFELRELVNLNYAAAKAKAKKAAQQSPKPSLQASVMADPKLMALFVSIKPLLTNDEAAQIAALGERLDEEQQEWLLAKIGALDPQNAVVLLREVLAEANATASPTQSPASPPA